MKGEGVDKNIMKGQTMKVAKETERSLPGMEEGPLPAGLERKLKLHHAAKCAKADADSEVKDTFAVVEEAMHEAEITSCKIRINGKWMKTERG